MITALVLVLIAGQVAVAARLAIWWWQDRITPIPADWPTAELAAVGVAVRAWRGQRCTVCGGRHCPGCEAPARITATTGRHGAGAHGLDRTPAEVRRPLSLMTPVERARELAWTAAVAAWRPVGDRPPVDRREAGYLRQTGRRGLTAAQRRRAIKKRRRAVLAGRAA